MIEVAARMNRVTKASLTEAKNRQATLFGFGMELFASRVS
jgi:hypothetical protein